jgi:serine kinase of HPr protein (carbohydrate metabolism regulator)
MAKERWDFMADSVTVRQLVKATKLEVYSGEEYLDQRQVVLSDISRPGLELTGYFNYYPHERIQLFGRTEISFARNMSSEERLLILKRMATEDTPAFLVSRGVGGAGRNDHRSDSGSYSCFGIAFADDAFVESDYRVFG